MIKLTKLNDENIFINADMVMYIEQMPDTVITLSNRDKIIVKEDPFVVIKKFIEYKRLIHLFPGSL